MVATAAKRSFVPANFNAADWAQVEPLYRALLARPVSSTAELEKWLGDFSELWSVMDEHGARLYIDKSCHTDDPEIKKRFLNFIEEIDPRTKPLHFELQKKFLASPYAAGLTDKKYAVLRKNWQADVDLFREENVPLETESAKLITEYDAIAGEMMVNFRGQELTLQQLAKHFENPDRATRQEAWELSAQRRYQDQEKIEEIFDQLLKLRERIAVNAGMPNFRAYVW